jgi:hypothetical protein
MGTRNLICGVVDGEMKVAQYCQWDGYIDGQGKWLAEYIHKNMKFRTLKSAMRKCKFVSDNIVEALWESAGAVNGGATEDVSQKFKLKFPQFHRDIGYQIFRLIQDGVFTVNTMSKDYKYTTTKHKVDPVRELTNSGDFSKDGLFCEYAYVLDMDKKVLEVYTGDGELKGHIKEMPCYAKVPFADCTADFMVKLSEKYDEEREE